MRTITTTEDLASFCAAAKSQPYVTIDTEFLRERTYWSKLCLIQMALPGANGDAVLVDPIEGADMSLEPLYDLFRHEATVKVFHAARQDLEIFFVEGSVFPESAVRHPDRRHGLRLWRTGRLRDPGQEDRQGQSRQDHRASPTGRAVR